MKSKVIQRTVYVDDCKTSISLENDFWNSLKEIAAQRGQTLIQLISNINTDRKCGTLSSAVRLFVVGVYRDQYKSGSKPADVSIEARSAA
jgi:predicted DNA-binding ribbon-helix-helix protein